MYVNLETINTYFMNLEIWRRNEFRVQCDVYELILSLCGKLSIYVQFQRSVYLFEMLE